MLQSIWNTLILSNSNGTKILTSEIIQKIIKAIGRENLYKIIINYGGITIYMAVPNKLTLIPIKNIDNYNIECIRIDQLIDKYRKIAELIGIKFLYRLAYVIEVKHSI